MKCPYCKKEARWCDNEEVYGRRYGKSYMCYWCKDCDAYVGCHNNTNVPLGTMANKELRQWRMRVHALLDPIWRLKRTTRKDIYSALSGMFQKQFHVGECDIEECQKAIEFLESHYSKEHHEA